MTMSRQRREKKQRRRTYRLTDKYMNKK